MSKVAELKKLGVEYDEITKKMNQLFTEGHLLDLKNLSSEDLSEWFRLKDVNSDLFDQMCKIIKRKPNE